jgi:hypothetical protein
MDQILGSRPVDSEVAAPQCTKIGGYLPYDKTAPSGCDFFCFLGPIVHAPSDEYPWLNQPEPLNAHPYNPWAVKEFMWGDCDGCPMFFDSHRRIRCY